MTLKWASLELEAPQRLLPPFKDEHVERAQINRPAPLPPPKGKPLHSQVVG